MITHSVDPSIMGSTHSSLIPAVSYKHWVTAPAWVDVGAVGLEGVKSTRRKEADFFCRSRLCSRYYCVSPYQHTQAMQVVTSKGKRKMRLFQPMPNNMAGGCKSAGTHVHGVEFYMPRREQAQLRGNNCIERRYGKNSAPTCRKYLLPVEPV